MKVTSITLKMSAVVAAIAMAPASAKIIMAGDSTMAQSSTDIQGYEASLIFVGCVSFG